MVGKYRLFLGNNEVEYDLGFERNITVLAGDSNTGKSFFVDMLESAILERRNEGTTTSNYTSDFDIVIVARDDNTSDIKKKIDNEKKLLGGGKSCLIVLDEDNYIFKKSGEINKLVTTVDSYFLFVTREIKGVSAIGYLPFSVKSVYRFISEKNSSYTDLEVNTTEFKQLCDKYNKSELKVNVDVVFTEDACSGYDFFKKHLNIDVRNTGGKGRYRWSIGKYLRSMSKGKTILFIVDGAGFGCHISDILTFKEDIHEKFGAKLIVSTPESFEWLVLNSPIFYKYVSNELSSTYEYCDSLQFLSWERYFTGLLEKTSDRILSLKYTKSKGGVDTTQLLDMCSSDIISWVEDELNGHTII